MLSVDAIKKAMPEWKVKVMDIMDGTVMTCIMTLLTILVLFMDDMRLAFFPASTDQIFVILTYISLIAFTIELSKIKIIKIIKNVIK